MAIKKRTPSAADIEAFGDAADKPASAAVPSPAPATPAAAAEPAAAAARPAGRSAGPGWPVGVAKTLTLRYPDPELPLLLAQLAEIDERSQHNTAVRALRRGLQEILRETKG